MPRDWSIKPSPEDFEEFERVFKTMPTWNEDESTISAEEIPKFLQAIEYYRTPEEFAIYIEFWNRNGGGKIPLQSTLCMLGIDPETAVRGTALAAGYDKDGNGFVSVEEFKDLLPCIQAMNPGTPKIDSDEFLKTADRSGDGKVSIEECAAWIKTQLDRTN